MRVQIDGAHNHNGDHTGICVVLMAHMFCENDACGVRILKCVHPDLPTGVLKYVSAALWKEINQMPEGVAEIAAMMQEDEVDPDE